MDYSIRIVLWMIVSVGDIGWCWFRDKAIEGVMRALVETGTKKEAIFRSLDAVL